MPWRPDHGRISEVAVWYINGNRYALCFDYDVGAVDQIKALPAHRRRWDPRLKFWHIFGEEAAYRLAEIASAYLDVQVEHYLTQPDWVADRAAWIENRGWEKTSRWSTGSPGEAPGGPFDARVTRAETDAYAILGVTPGASAELIKVAYRVAAREHHPDAGGDPERMKAINKAYEELTT